MHFNPFDVASSVLTLVSVQSDPEGALWRDPPGYWDDIVYPAYVDAHRELFDHDNVETGRLSGEKVPDLVLLETLQISLSEAVTKSCDAVKQFLMKSYA